jgi:pyruvate dehydrogenase E1 component alpha subunit
LIENVTYRWRGHSRSDVNRYRTKEEIEAWQEKCPIERFCEHLLDEEVITEDEIDRIKDEAYTAIEGAVEFSEASPDPDLKTIEEGVYA